MRRLLPVALLSSAVAAAGTAPPAPVIHGPTHASSELPASTLGYDPGHMDRGIDSRQDFYGYATGRFMQQLRIPDAEPDIGGFSMLRANLDAQLLQIARQAARAGAPKGSPAQQVGDFYRAATDTARIDAAGLQPVQPELDAALRVASPVDLARLSARLQLGIGGTPLVNVLSTIDLKDSTRTRMLLYPAGPQLQQAQYTDPAAQRIRDLYVGYITAAYRQLGDASDVAADKARRILAMETALMAPRLKPIELLDPAKTYNIVSFADAQALVPGIDLRAQITDLGLAVPDEVQVLDPGAMKAMQALLGGGPPQDVQLLLHWGILSGTSKLLGAPWRTMAEDHERQRDGLAQSLPLERQVVQSIGNQLSHPLSQLYVQAHFPERTRNEIRRMIGHIKDEFALRLRSNPWLDAPTRAAALDKLAKIDIRVGYDRWQDMSAVDIRPDDHFGNARALVAHSMRRELARIGKPVEREHFANPVYTAPIAVNAGYSPQNNGIEITAAIAQPPFYKAGADLAVNYCTMGAVIGHELTHGFDSNGRRYDAAGNLRDWWTPQAAAAFKQRTDVLVAQYNQFPLLPGLNQNGALTLTENTADLGGITLAHAALQRALRGKKQPRVDGLGTDQRCFVAWTQMWTYKAREERVRLLAATDYHANSAVRAFAPLLNLDAFHQAFRTRPGDAMWRAPADRVRIW